MVTSDYLLILAAVAVLIGDALIAPAGFGLPFIYAALIWFMPSTRRLEYHAFRMGVLFAAFTIVAMLFKTEAEVGVVLFNRFMALVYIGGSTHMVRDQLHSRRRIDQLERRIGAG